MQLLRDLWGTIAPEWAVGKESADARRQKELWQGRERAQQHRRIVDMRERVRSYHANGIDAGRKLSGGDKGFCRLHGISFS